MPRKLFGLDETIRLAGRNTTIREQFGLGKTTPMPVKSPYQYRVSIEKDGQSSEAFDISEADFKFLGGHAT